MLCLLISCQKGSDPVPDLTNDLVGTYVGSHGDNGLGISYITTITWTISKTDNDKIKIDHVETSQIEALPGSPYVIEPSKPVISIIDGITVERDDRFAFDRLVEWTSDGDIFKTTVVVDAVLAGRDLDVKITQTTDGDTDSDRLIMKRQ